MSPRRRRRLASTLEPLEARIAPATTVTFSAGTLTIAGQNGQDETILLQTLNSTLQITDTLHSVTNGGGGTQNGANEVDIPLASLTGDINIDLGTGADKLTFDVTLNLGAGRSLTAHSAGQVQVSASAAITASGIGNIGLTGDAGVTLLNNASLTVAAGTLSLSGNAAGTTPGTFVGLDLNGAALSALTTGGIVLIGKGGDTGGGNHGVYLHGGAGILGGNGGAISITGTGGDSSGSASAGVLSPAGGVTILAGQASLTITGTGGSGPGTGNAGVVFGGSLSGDNGPMVISGSGQSGGGTGHAGVVITGSVSSLHGAVQLSGTGGATTNPFDYTNATTRLANSADKTELDAYQFGIYSAWNSQNWFAQGLLSYGFQSYKNSRAGVLLGDLTSTPSGRSAAAAGKLGYLFNTGSVRVGPIAGLTYASSTVNAYTENGDAALALNVGKQTVEALSAASACRRACRLHLAVSRSAPTSISRPSGISTAMAAPSNTAPHRRLSSSTRGTSRAHPRAFTAASSPV